MKHKHITDIHSPICLSINSNGETQVTDIFEIKTATAQDVPLILSFIKELAAYEKLSDKVVATEEILRETLFCNPVPGVPCVPF